MTAVPEKMSFLYEEKKRTLLHLLNICDILEKPISS